MNKDFFSSLQTHYLSAKVDDPQDRHIKRRHADILLVVPTAEHLISFCPLETALVLLSVFETEHLH